MRENRNFHCFNFRLLETSFITFPLHSTYVLIFIFVRIDPHSWSILLKITINIEVTSASTPDLKQFMRAFLLLTQHYWTSQIKQYAATVRICRILKCSLDAYARRYQLIRLNGDPASIRKVARKYSCPWNCGRLAIKQRIFSRIVGQSRFADRMRSFARSRGWARLRAELMFRNEPSTNRGKRAARWCRPNMASRLPLFLPHPL